MCTQDRRRQVIRRPSAQSFLFPFPKRRVPRLKSNSDLETDIFLKSYMFHVTPPTHFYGGPNIFPLIYIYVCESLIRPIIMKV